MPVQGNYGTPSNPLADIYSERIQLTPVTADPSSATQGDVWLRTDLDSGDKIATVRWYDGTATNDVPVFATGSSGHKVEEVLRIQTPNGKGYIPTRNAYAAFPQQRLRHNSTTYQWHNDQAAPVGGVMRATFDDDDTSSGTAIDVWNGYDGTITGATTGVTGQFNQAYSFDGTDDEVNFGTISEATGVAEASLSVWVNLDQTYSNTHTVFSSYQSADSQLSINLNSGNWYFRVDNGTDSVFVEPSAQVTGSWVHLVLTYNAGTLTAYVDADSGTSNTGGPSTTPGNLGAFYTAYAENVDQYIAADIDDPQVYDFELSANQVDTINTDGSL